MTVVSERQDLPVRFGDAGQVPEDVASELRDAARRIAYSTSKAALNMLSDHIAVEYGTRGIISNTLMPAIAEAIDHIAGFRPKLKRTAAALRPISRPGPQLRYRREGFVRL